MPISAAKLPEARDDLRRLLAGDFIGTALTGHAHKGGRTDLPAPECHKPWAQAVDGYQQRLRHMVDTAELFHVSDEMTAVAAEAGLTMPGYKLHRDDLPADSGLIVFDAPLSRATHDTMALNPQDAAELENVAWAESSGRKLPAVEVIAALWRFALRDDGRPGVLVVLLTSNYDMADSWEAEGYPDMAVGLRRIGWLGYHDETVLPFGHMYDENTIAPDDPQPIRNQTFRTLIATWLLMSQPIVTSDPEPLPRQVRRAWERANGGKPAPKVRVVKLRHVNKPRPEGADSDGITRTYHSSWVVRGHWRNQWYPSRKDHKPLYIPSHIKGPKDAPLKGTEKVYDWSR